MLAVLLLKSVSSATILVMNYFALRQKHDVCLARTTNCVTQACRWGIFLTLKAAEGVGLDLVDLLGCYSWQALRLWHLTCWNAPVALLFFVVPSIPRKVSVDWMGRLSPHTRQVTPNCNCLLFSLCSVHGTSRVQAVHNLFFDLTRTDYATRL